MRSRICSELSSRKPSWPAFNVRARKQAGHMDASDLIKALQKHLARRGPSTYGECQSSVLSVFGSPMEPPDMPTPFVAGQAGLASGPHSTYRPADRGAPTARNVMAIRRRRDLAAPDRSVGCG